LPAAARTQKVIAGSIPAGYISRWEQVAPGRTPEQNGDEVPFQESLMDKPASHGLLGRLHMPRLAHVIAWVIAVLLAIAWYAVWVLPVF
jgi:hypothetical protein